jgi:hypothetical protein
MWRRAHGGPFDDDLASDARVDGAVVQVTARLVQLKLEELRHRYIARVPDTIVARGGVWLRALVEPGDRRTGLDRKHGRLHVLVADKDGRFFR